MGAGPMAKKTYLPDGSALQTYIRFSAVGKRSYNQAPACSYGHLLPREDALEAATEKREAA